MDNQTNHNPESYKPKHVAPKIKRRNTLTIVLFVLAFIMIGVGIWWVIAKRPTTKNVAKVPVKSCSEDKAVIANFISAINKNDRNTVQDIYNQTKSNPYLEKDISCLYIAVKSAIYFGDAASGVTYAQQLKSIYSDNNQFNALILATGDNIGSLLKSVDFLKVQADNLNSATTFGGVKRDSSQ